MPRLSQLSRVARAVNTEVLVVGAGIAGSATALAAAQRGLDVAVLCTGLGDGCSHWAQGGIIYKGKHDSPALLARDIEVAGAGGCCPRAVDVLSQEGPEAVEEMCLPTTRFDTTPSGELALCLEGGHGLPRIVHVGDKTGKAMMQALHKLLLGHPRVTVLAGLSAHELALDGSRAVGVDAVDSAGRGVAVSAGTTVIATGGVGELFEHTSNPASARGDGIGMALRAGVEAEDMEYVQFHPTTLAVPGHRNFLISEAVRGEGARLVNALGEYFATSYDERGELAPRDIVARMILSERQRTGEVFLECRFDPEFARERFPGISAYCERVGVEFPGMVPVQPAAHFLCGGLTTGLDGHTNVPGLFAVGEAARTGVHGANRLASTSLLEGLVFGRRAAAALEPVPVPPRRAADAAVAECPQEWRRLKAIMGNDVSVVRTHSGLARAESALMDLEDRVDRLGRTTGALQLRNSLVAGTAIVRAALANPTSRGTHYLEEVVEESYDTNLRVRRSALA